MKQIKRKRLRRALVLCAGALYLLVVIGATVYSQTGYVQSLPLVELGRADRGRLPESAVLLGEETALVYCVEQQEGPWGNRYVLRQVTSHNYQPMGEGIIFVYETVSLEEPLVLGASIPLESAYDGMEVRLA